MQNVSAITSNAMNMVANHREATTFDSTRFGLDKLLESVFEELLVLHMISFVFFWDEMKSVRTFYFRLLNVDKNSPMSALFLKVYLHRRQ